jgi:outer membrane protein assembly factor BamA
MADQALYDGSEITFIKADHPERKKELAEDLTDLIRPETNSSLKLWFYNLVGETNKEKGLKYWVKYKLGEKPVLFNYRDAERSRLVLMKYLQDQGYINAIVHLDTTSTKQRVTSLYEVKAEKRYKIGEIILPDGSSPLDSIVRANQKESFLRTNQYYKTENLTAERQRLATLVSQNGFYNINETDLFFYVDTFAAHDSLDIYVRWKPDIDSQDVKRHRLGNTTVIPTYSLAPPDSLVFDTSHLADIAIVSNARLFRDELFAKAIKGKTGDLYDGRLQASTINYLQNLDNFKFINVKTEKRIVDDIPIVDRVFYLTPTAFRRLRYDFEANTRSGSYFGLLAAINYSDRNWRGGAELLDISLSIGGETQTGNDVSFINTLELTASASVSIPNLWLPFIPTKLYNDYVARTRFSVSNSYQIRTGFFNINSLSAQVSYDWRSNQRTRHIWTPISIRQSRTSNISDEFQVELDENNRLKNSLENVLILGGQYQVVYSTQKLGKPRAHSLLSGTLEIAGNIPGVVASAFSSSKPYSIFGTPLSQFAKLDIDFRHYRPRRKRTWAFRLAAGVVKSYGNAEITPYSEQFYVGGSNSIRAFRIRELGPGSYVNRDSESINFFDQTGDIKLELNTEFRFDIATYFKGAVFVDAGNIWTIDQTDDDLRSGNFQFNSFYQEIAVGTGLGLRIDLDFFVIRLDGAFPIRQAAIDQGFDWTFNEIDFLNNQWRSENLVFHLAIGYPF